MAGKRRKRQQQDARRRAHLDRLASGTSGDAGEQRRSRARDDAARAAAAGPSAARWRVPGDPDQPGGGSVQVDVVADLLALDPRTSLHGRGEAELRGLAGHVEQLVQLGATCPSGRSLLEVVVSDAALRDEVAPTFDLSALLDGGPVSDRSHDRTVRLAGALLERAAAHRDGTVDLHAEVAPVGTPRHPDADGVEALVRVVLQGLALPAAPDPAVLTTTGGWLGLSPAEAFLGIARGLAQGAERDLLGAALHGWLARTAADPTDGWWVALSGVVEVDAAGLLQQAAARAGSDHPDVAGGPLAELVALRHPLA